MCTLSTQEYKWVRGRTLKAYVRWNSRDGSRAVPGELTLGAGLGGLMNGPVTRGYLCEVG